MDISNIFIRNEKGSQKYMTRADFIATTLLIFKCHYCTQQLKLRGKAGLQAHPVLSSVQCSVPVYSNLFGVMIHQWQCNVGTETLSNATALVW